MRERERERERERKREKLHNIIYQIIGIIANKIHNHPQAKNAIVFDINDGSESYIDEPIRYQPFQDWHQQAHWQHQDQDQHRRYARRHLDQHPDHRQQSDWEYAENGTHINILEQDIKKNIRSGQKKSGTTTSTQQISAYN